MNVDDSHNCVVCGGQLCNFCIECNYDKGDGDADVPKRFAICNNGHDEYLISHGYKQPNGWEETTVITDKTGLKDHIAGCDWRNVRATAGSTNPLTTTGQDPNNDEKNTKLKGFVIPSVGFIPVANANVDSLRAFLAKMKITGGRHGKKKYLADEIATKRGLFEQADAQGWADEFINNGGKRNGEVSMTSGNTVAINMKRYINVLTGNVMKPKIPDLNRKVSREGLENGDKMNEPFFRKFIREYNNSSKYNEDTSPSAVADFNESASAFFAFPENDWPRFESKYKDVMKCYNHVHIECTQSGSHDNFEDKALVRTNPYLLYLHNILEEFDDSDALRNSFFCDLPGDVFSQSTTSTSRRKSTATSSRVGNTRRHMQQPKKKQRSNNEDAALQAMATKSKSQGSLAREQRRSHLKDELLKEEKRKGEAKTLLKRRYGKQWRNKVEEHAAFKDGSDGDDSAEEDNQFSQPELLNQYRRSSFEVSRYENQLDKLDRGN